ncbi:hypothetical protein [Serratia fonticola]
MAGYAILPDEAFSWLKNNEQATFYLWAVIYLDANNYAPFIHPVPNPPLVRKPAWNNGNTKINTYKALGLGESPPTHLSMVLIV